MRLAIVGIRGIPNNYGGFETLAEYLVQYLVPEMEVTVYCSSKDMDSRLTTYNGASLRYIPVTSHGAFGIIYDSIALARAVFTHDKVLFLGFGAGFVMPFLKRFSSKIILNIGGLDWQRNKWSPFAQRVIRKAETLLIRHSGKIIADNIGIQKYITEVYGKPSTLIAYGGDQAQKQEITEEALLKYPFLKGAYAFGVCRIQPDNNIDMILEAFADREELPMVLVGNWDNSDYGLKTKAKYTGRKNLFLLDAIYNREELDVLRSNCTLYIHGHSAGGTNPSLAEAMCLALPVFAFASGYNEYTTGNKALYFTDLPQLIGLIDNYKQTDLLKVGLELKGIADEAYRWEKITGQYRELILNDVS